jgi:two-component system LytT family response regulator
MDSFPRPKFEGFRSSTTPGGSIRREPPRPRALVAGPSEPVALEAASSKAHLERLLVRENGRLVVVRLAEVDWIEGAGNYVRLHVGTRSHLHRQTLAQLEQRLDPTRFARIHRSTIVNLDRIDELRPTISGSYEVVLLGGERLTLSRGHRRRALELVESS